MIQPGSFVHWPIFDVSVANLVLIALLVAIFGATVLLPFPRGHRPEPAPARPRRDLRGSLKLPLRTSVVLALADRSAAKRLGVFYAGIRRSRTRSPFVHGARAW